jgi:hypothetical protein
MLLKASLPMLSMVIVLLPCGLIANWNLQRSEPVSLGDALGASGV